VQSDPAIARRMSAQIAEMLEQNFETVQDLDIIDRGH
jgi:hypothetical protein